MFIAVSLLILSGLCWTAYGCFVSKCSHGDYEYDIVQGWCGLLIGLCGLAGCLWRTAYPVVQSDGVVASAWPSSAGACIAGLVFLLGGGVGSCLANSFTSKAMRVGPNGLSWAIQQSALLSTFLMGVLCFHEQPGVVRFIGMGLLLAGVFLMGSVKCGGGSSSGRWLAMTLLGLLFAMASQCCCAITSYFPQWNVSVNFRAMAANAGIFVGYVFALCVNPRLRRLPKTMEWRLLLLQVIICFASNFIFFYDGLDRLTALGMGGVAYPITLSVCVLGMELYALLILHEKTPLRGWLGVAGLLAGIICLTAL